MKNFATRDESIQANILGPIEACGLDPYKNFDVEGIANAILDGFSRGYRQMVEAWEFWEVVYEFAL